MAWFDSNKNRAYQAYPETEPGYGGIAYPDYVNRRFSDGREAIVGFSATQNSKSYVATTEQVIEYKRFPAVEDHRKHSPTRKDLYKDHGTRDKPMIGSWGPDHGPPEKARDFSPKLGNHQMIQAQNKGSPRTTRDHYGKCNNFSSDDDDSDDNYDDDDDGVFYEKNNNNEKHKLGGNNFYDPPSYTSYYETPYPNNGYSPPSSYTVPLTTPPPPTKDQPKYYETPYPYNGYSPPSSYTVPLTTPPPPTKDQPKYYETSNNNNYNRPLLNNPPPPIKTGTDTGRAREFASESPKNSPVSSAVAKHPQFVVASPKKSDIQKGRQETIDSAEARRRYGKASPGAGGRVEQKYTVTIDSREAARKYKGVFVPA